MIRFNTILNSTLANLFLASLLLVSGSVMAQKNMKERAENMPMISFSYGFYNSAGDLAKRFGANSNVALQFQYKTKSNFVFGAEGAFIFGKNVRENTILDHIASAEGEVFDKESQVSSIIFFERGYTISGTIGKIFPVIGPNPNCGILVKLGGGFIQHKIRNEHQNNRIPQLEGDYAKGYDRLTNGFMVSQFLGYMHMSNSKLANFYIGFESIEGFTKNRRELNFDTKMKDDTKRLDIMYGLKLGICINLYKRTSTDYYTE